MMKANALALDLFTGRQSEELISTNRGDLKTETQTQMKHSKILSHDSSNSVQKKTRNDYVKTRRLS